MFIFLYICLIANAATNSLLANYDFDDVYKHQLSRYSLSNKGDLPANTDGIKRRVFRMPGDGNCFLWSAGITRSKAVEIWLDHATNPAIRAMGSAEIFEAFFCDELPKKMKEQANFKAFKALLVDVQLRLDNENTRIRQMAALGVPYSDVALRAIEAEERALFDRIRNEYCAKESVYRDFVNLILSQDSYYLFTTVDSLNDRPLFIDILGFDQNKNIITYAYVPNNKSLVATHRYLRPGGANGTWEMVLQGQHYNRVVPINNAKEIKKAELDELTYLASLFPPLPLQLPRSKIKSPITPKKPAKKTAKPQTKKTLNKSSAAKGKKKGKQSVAQKKPNKQQVTKSVTTKNSTHKRKLIKKVQKNTRKKVIKSLKGAFVRKMMAKKKPRRIAIY